MRALRYNGAALLLLAAVGAPCLAQGQAPAEQSDVLIAPSWKDGFLLQSSDGAFRVRTGGLVQADGRYFPGNTAPGPVDQFSIRSARLELEGTLWRYFDFRVNADFSGGRLQLQEAWAEVRFAPE